MTDFVKYRKMFGRPFYKPFASCHKITLLLSDVSENFDMLCVYLFLWIKVFIVEFWKTEVVLKKESVFFFLSTKCILVFVVEKLLLL